MPFSNQVPTADVSLVDLTVRTKKACTAEEMEAWLRRYRVKDTEDGKNESDIELDTKQDMEQET